MRKIHKILLGAAILASTANAEMYVGGTVGSATINSGITTTTGTANVDEKDISKSLILGYNINQYFSLEGFYTDLGNVEVTGNAGDSTTSSIFGNTYVFPINGYNEKLDAKAFGVSVLAKYNLHDIVTPYFKIGVHKYNTKVSSNAGFESKKSGTDTHLGLGLEKTIVDNIVLRVGYDRYYLGKYDADNTNFSLIYNF